MCSHLTDHRVVAIQPQLAQVPPTTAKATRKIRRQPVAILRVDSIQQALRQGKVRSKVEQDGHVPRAMTRRQHSGRLHGPATELTTVPPTQVAIAIDDPDCSASRPHLFAVVIRETTLIAVEEPPDNRWIQLVDKGIEESRLARTMRSGDASPLTQRAPALQEHRPVRADQCWIKLECPLDPTRGKWILPGVHPWFDHQRFFF